MQQDELDLVFFDLLEGNYDAITHQKMLAKILSNPELQAQWQDWQKSILHQEILVFEDKEKLYKIAARSKTLPIWYFSAAASLLIVFFIGLYLVKMPIKKQKIVQNKIILPQLQTKNPIAKNEKSPILEIDANQSKSFKKVYIKKAKPTEKLLESNVAILSTKIEKVLKDTMLEEKLNTNSIADIENNNVIENTVYGKPIVKENNKNKSWQLKFNGILAWFQKPKITATASLEPIDFNIKITTSVYTLNLKP